MSSELSVVNEALVRLGVPPLSSLSDQSAQALSASNIYKTIRADELSAHPWWFALREVPLPRLSLVPEDTRLTDYTNAFQLPPDIVRVVGLRSLEPFALAGDQLYANGSEARLVAIFDVPESSWPAYFREVVAFSTAAAFAISITDATNRAELFYGLADRARRQARSTNAQQLPPEMLNLLRIYQRQGTNILAQA